MGLTATEESSSPDLRHLQSSSITQLMTNDDGESSDDHQQEEEQTVCLICYHLFPVEPHRKRGRIQQLQISVKNIEVLELLARLLRIKAEQFLEKLKPHILKTTSLFCDQCTKIVDTLLEYQEKLEYLQDQIYELSNTIRQMILDTKSNSSTRIDCSSEQEEVKMLIESFRYQVRDYAMPKGLKEELLQDSKRLVPVVQVTRSRPKTKIQVPESVWPKIQRSYDTTTQPAEGVDTQQGQERLCDDDMNSPPGAIPITSDDDGIESLTRDDSDFRALRVKSEFELEVQQEVEIADDSYHPSPSVKSIRNESVEGNEGKLYKHKNPSGGMTRSKNKSQSQTSEKLRQHYIRRNEQRREERRKPFMERKGSCPHCPEVFMEFRLYQRHILSEHPKKLNSCKICGKPGYPGSGSVGKHVWTHKGKSEIEELLALGKRVPLSVLQAFGLRPKTCKKQQPRQCNICGLILPSASSYYGHVSRHATERNFICDVCSNSFTTKKNLQLHKVQVHPSDPDKYQCATCLKTFAWKKVYEQHLRMHTGEKPYQCETCGKAFTSRHSHNRHRRTHEN